MKRQWFSTVVAAVGLLALTSASAQAQVVQVSRGGDSRHAIGFSFGYFFVTSAEGRASGTPEDTILANLDDLAFEVNDFNNVTFGGEYLFGINDYLEAGVGVGYYQKTVNSVYANFVNTHGSEIEQDLKLRIVPVTATIRFLPVGRTGPVQPYVGGGIGFFNWRYSEIGDFVDFDNNNTVFSNRSDPFIADGTAVGPVLLGGVRFPVGDALTFGGEVRWQKATGDTGGLSAGFLGEKIDLGGTTVNFTIHFRF
jgi:opacity protein-like surface antigen